MRLPVRLGALLAGAALVISVAGSVPAEAAGDTVQPGASKAHPYSDPIWFPLASPAEMGCVKDNPGCPPSGVQPRWDWDIQTHNEPAGEYHQKVYAMGAGIVHVLFKHQSCGGSDESRGNTLYIDHGNGVISMYSHLAGHFLVHDGDYVSARTPIGLVGQSGYTKCAEKPKVRFLAIVVMHHAKRTKAGGLAGDDAQVKQTYTCVQGAKTEWPQQLPGNDGSWTRWYNVPVDTPIPNTSDDRPCIHTPPSTAPHPADAALKRSSSTSLKGSWKRAAAKYHVGSVQAQLQQYHPTIHEWLDLQTHTLPGTAASTRFTNLPRNGSFRMRVWFHNHVGWSASTSWQHHDL